MRVPLVVLRRPAARRGAQPRSPTTSTTSRRALQQTLSQILIALLTVVGVLVMLVVISPLLAVIALVTVPLSVVITAKIGKRAQKGFVAQWKHVGALNGQIEEAFTGHALVKVFGRRAQIEARFRAKNDELFDASVPRAVRVEHHHAGDRRSSETSTTSRSRWSAGCASRRARCCSAACRRSSSTRASSRSSSASSRQVANVLQSGVASAERVFELLDAPDQSADRRPTRARGADARRGPVRGRRRSATSPTCR